ncbi:MAG: acyl-CoA dehydrogenase family protein [Acetobacteraceae bacterium]|nr:acyl-CoA dehydrogenase family protein [Acetobacteraceae bacterium]
MALTLDAEARLIRDQAVTFFEERSPVRALRALRDAGDPDGFSRALWREMAELGWAGFLVPEAHGGTEAGALGLGLVLEAAGRTLAPTPLLSTALIGASALVLGGNPAQRAAQLPAIAAGTRLVALALEEGTHHDPARTGATARRSGNGWRLDGTKSFVPDGGAADLIIAVVRTEDGLGLFLVPADAPGVTRERRRMVDGRNAAAIRFEGVSLPAGARLEGGGPGLLDAVLDRARIGQAAEMLGATGAAFDRTLQYLKDRRQFGVPIGSFQALKHRAARMFEAMELLRSTVLAALEAIDEGSPDLPRLASLAKAQAGEAFFLIGNEAIQMHGGIGMTDEHEIGFYLKRARVAQATFGDSAYHRDRYAALSGF